MFPLVSTALFVRWLHLVGVGLVLGGAVLTWAVGRRAITVDDTDSAYTAIAVAEAYEWIFWTALGTIVAAGVGNLGVFGNALPAPQTAWGRILTLKLTIVLLFIVGSAFRTLLIAFAVSTGNPDHGTSRRIRTSYAATAVVLFALLGLGEVLAHG